jgi:hypothetical protein
MREEADAVGSYRPRRNSFATLNFNRTVPYRARCRA